MPNARVEWGANVVVDKEELPGSFRIKVFLAGENQPQAASTGNAGNGGDLVGVAPIFSSPEKMDDGNRYLNFTVPLTRALVEKNIALNPEETVPNLTDRLYWVVEKVCGLEFAKSSQTSALTTCTTGWGVSGHCSCHRVEHPSSRGYRRSRRIP